jgi:transposase InsO family protein
MQLRREIGERPAPLTSIVAASRHPSLRHPHRQCRRCEIESRARDVPLQHPRRVVRPHGDVDNRRLGYLLAREGLKPNHKKLLRLYREEGLKVRRRGGRKRPLETRAPMALPQGPNQRWSLDFVSDALGCGRRFRILCVVDDFTRECLALVPDTSLSGARVARELDKIAVIRGKPLAVVSDNGTELTSASILCQRRLKSDPLSGCVPVET